LLDYALLRGKKDELQILYRFKATQADFQAQYELGMLSGEEDAPQWFWLSAQQGYVPAMVELSKAYLEPDSSLYDPVEGAAWLLLAENSGFSDESYNSAAILADFSDEDKLEVSRRFTELYYTEPESDNPLRGNIP